MPEELSGSPITHGYRAAWIEEGTIIAVHPKTFKVDWSADSSERRLFELAAASPYIHQGFGEGLTMMPEVGAKAVVCHPSDESVPFILAYYADPEEKQDSNGESDTDYKSGREDLGPGDFMWKGRNGNKLYLRRGGMVQLGSGPNNQTFYFPSSNLLWDACKRYKMDTSGGQIQWEVKESRGNLTEMRALLRETAGAANASVMVRCGNLPDAPKVPASTPTPTTILYELVVAPNAINKDGAAPIQTMALRFDKSGNMYQYTKGSVVTVIENDTLITVNNRTSTIKNNDTLSVTGNRTEAITGNRVTTAARQHIRGLSEVLLDAPIVRSGASGTQPVALSAPLIAWLAAHTHPVAGAVAGPCNESAALQYVVPTKTFFVSG
jgi:hypothetical protein